VLYGCVLWFGFYGYGLRLKFKEIFQGQFSKIGFKVKFNYKYERQCYIYR